MNESSLKGHWSLWRTRKTKNAAERRGRRPRIEILEDRTLLNASIDIGSDGVLTYDTGLAERTTLQIRVTGDVYTFESDGLIDVVANAPALSVAGDGTSMVSVQGISRLNVSVRTDLATVEFASTNVETTVNSYSQVSQVYLGALSNPNGLADLTAHVSFVPMLSRASNIVRVTDVGSTKGEDYTVTATTVTATGGFAGLSYSDLFMLQVEGSTTALGETARFNVLGTSDRGSVHITANGQPGSHSEFKVDSPATESQTTSLNLAGGGGTNTFNILNVSSVWLGIFSRDGTGVINVTNGGTTAGIQQTNFFLRPLGSGYNDLVIDNSAGVDATETLLTIPDFDSWPGPTLTGFGAPGSSAAYFPDGIRQVTYKSPKGLNNALTVDFSHGKPLPAGADSSLIYDGGHDDQSNSKSDLTLVGVPRSGAFASETHQAVGAGAGEIQFDVGLWSTGLIRYSGLSPHSLYDLVPATDYRFNYLGEPDPGVLVQAGEKSAATRNAQTLLIRSQGTVPAFSDTHIANKTNVTINTNGSGNGYVTKVDYRATEPVPGLSALTIITSPNDDVSLLAPPPGVDVGVQSTAAPRPRQFIDSGGESVAVRAITISGQLDPRSDSGASNSDGITNVALPRFFGNVSKAGSLVYLFATPTGGSPVLIGQTTADSHGDWSVTLNSALADGGYMIQAQAYDASGRAISGLATVAANLVIDTVGPRIVDVVLDKAQGRAIVSFEDFGGVANAGTGLSGPTLQNIANYSFSWISSPWNRLRGVPTWLATSIVVTPGSSVGRLVATVQINDGRRIRGGHYLFQIRSANPSTPGGVQDVAGNALDGAFTARIDALRNRIQIPPGVNPFVRRAGRPLPLANSAVNPTSIRAPGRLAALRRGLT